MTYASDGKAHPQLIVRPEWLALGREEIIEPNLPIVDAHHHLWNGYLLPELLADIDTGHNISQVNFSAKRIWSKRP